MTGQIFAIVGPSGVGKDSLLAAVLPHLPELHVVRRAITRPEEAGGEPFEGVSDAEFQARLDGGDFALHWDAHGLRYGIPEQVRDVLASGQSAIFNGSRAMLLEAQAAFPELTVLSITASRDVLAARLTARNRETPEQIEQRLDRASLPLPDGLRVVEIDNSGPLELATEALLRVLQPVKA